MPKPKWKRKILIVLGVCCLIAATLIASLPLWLPWILRPVVRGYGADFSAYQRFGYGRYALTAVTFTNAAVRIHAGRAEAVIPTVWLWRHYFGAKEGGEPFLRVEDWRLEVLHPEGRGAGRKTVTSLPTVLDEVQAVLAEVQDWVPLATMSNGVVNVQGQDIRIPNARWEQGALNAHASLPPWKETATVKITSGKTFPRTFGVAVPEFGIESQWKVSRAADAATLEGEAVWRSNVVHFTAEFDGQGWLPDAATLQVRDFRLPTEVTRLEGYGDVTGSVLSEWNDQRFRINLTAGAQPREDEKRLPPLEAAIKVGGDTNSFRIETATVSSPWLKLNLSAPVELDFRGRLRGPPAEFRIDADLDHQPWIAAGGHVEAKAFVQRGSNDLPDIAFELAATNLRAFDVRATNATVRGHFGWPWLDIQQATFELGGDAKAEASARFNVTNRTFKEGNFQFSGAMPTNFFSTNLWCERISLSAQFSGPWQQLAHSGKVQIQKLSVPRLNPLEVEAQWKGKFLALEEIAATLRAGESVLQLAGAATLTNAHARLRLDELNLTRTEQPLFKLSNPTTIEARWPTTTNEPNSLSVAVSKFLWQGNGHSITGEADVVWPARGRLSVGVQSVRAEFFQDFVQNELPKVTMESLALSAHWTNGPIFFAVASTAKLAVQDSARGIMPSWPTAASVGAIPRAERELSASLQATGTAEGITLERLILSSGEEEVVTGNGRVPITIRPVELRKSLQANVKQPLEFQARVRSHKSFWDDIAPLLHARLVEPDVSITVSGTLESPQGNVVVHIPEVQWVMAAPRGSSLSPADGGEGRGEGDARLAQVGAAKTDTRTTPHPDPLPFGRGEGRDSKSPAEIPPLKNIEARIVLDRQRALVEQLSLLVEEQPVTMQGEVPFEFGKSLGDVVQWENARAQIEIKDAKVAAAARFFPTILLPQGTVNVSARLEPGLQVHGELKLRGAAVRPLLAIGAVQEVDADLQLEGRQVEIKDFHGTLDGQPISAKGKVELPEKNFKAGLAAIDVHVQGQNIPLVRQSEIVVRSDVDVTIAKSKNGRTVVSGKVNLRNSVFLSDLKTLVPGKVARTLRPPPYFSVEIQPFADWGLDLTVSGEQFLKVRSPLFRGEISAALKCNGTLRDPVALGQVTVSSGTVLFPFASLKVSFGLITLTSDNPYQPRLSLTAASRVYGYDVKMNLSGFADDPVIEFSSTPPLSSEQVVLMITSGQLPSDEREFSASQRAGRFALFMGKNLLAKLGFESDSERLTIRSGEDISEEGKQTYYLEYKLTEKLSLVGEYDRFNALNAGIKWKVYSK